MTPPAPHPPRHAEAFKLMIYQCQQCGYAERIWNSRDGVTPFGVGCRHCGDDAMHTSWRSDQYLPDHDPKPGDRYFRDGLPEEARAFFRSRLERGLGTPYEVPREEWDKWITEALSDAHGEFQPGWPRLVVRGTDADTLPVRAPR